MPRPSPTPPALIPSKVRERLNQWVSYHCRLHREYQTDVARRAGMSPQLLGQVLSGRRHNPTITTVYAVLQALGKSWADLD
jgi:transcriptional regulator with XRE-family HTH domain